MAAVGVNDLGVCALAEQGVDLRRCAFVELRRRLRADLAADVLSAVISGFDLVLVGMMGSRVPIRNAVARKLTARMRDHGTSLICVENALLTDGFGLRGSGLRPEIRMRIDRPFWDGIGSGHGRLLARQVQVTVDGRGAASRPRRFPLWLPTPDCAVGLADVDVAESLEAPRLEALDDLQQRRAV